MMGLMKDSTMNLIGGLHYLESQLVNMPRAGIALRLAEMRFQMGPNYRRHLVSFGTATAMLRRADDFLRRWNSQN